MSHPRPNDADRLLDFLSALRAGSWPRYQQAVAALLPPEERHHAAMRAAALAEDLSALGHVEFAFPRRDWVVTSPVLAEVPAQGIGHAVLCGRRDSTTLASFHAHAERLGIPVAPTTAGTDLAVVLVRADSRDHLRALAAAAGIGFAPNAASRLARVLPRVGQLGAVAPPTARPFGHDAERLDPDSLRWRSVPTFDEPGAYRLDAYQREHWLVTPDGAARRLPRPIVVHAALAAVGRDPFDHRPASGELVLPRVARPPLLHDRALALASGHPPSRDDRGGPLTYRCVDARIAQAVRSSLQDVGDLI